MNLKTRPVEYKDGKTTCIGYLAWDESRADPLPCVLINHASVSYTHLTLPTILLV